ncbi:oxidoreductase [Amylolactobacillus amylotrophicus DSM 20534]|uniref:Oxidoreductase n=3 Tax=Amylolactobacillus TaxID=2767876 RepID=A0A0R1YL08_9LACO|nr:MULTISPECIES: NAD(P)H-binding protein [Amylolactobacillus]APT17850.1 NAD-dependent dehydratase [Amylolactobacillus amylophilus DSM 20533 = JCM 1125]KRK38448.1 oxidoreductase [Amylolactobacillus amylotrophicus DSM 20534]KRM42909.1 oxidoreductase [Amylolactobacillus amylophilus DSM 20533 = JCM 1125]GED79774.1 oxidoreductase [Amylolactobacillus amylophilus]
MQIFVVGGSGRVATELIKDLVEMGHTVVAGARHEEQIVKLPAVKPVHLDLHAPVRELVELMKGSAVVYFTAGSRGKDLLQTDAFGAVKTMQAAEQAGIKRYVMLSSNSSLEPEQWHREGLRDLMDYNVAKFFADNYLVNQTKLDYTILQPTSLTEKSGTGRISVVTDLATTNPIPDVAQTLAEILQHDNTIGHVIAMSTGDKTIADALSSVE